MRQVHFSHTPKEMSVFIPWLLTLPCMMMMLTLFDMKQGSFCALCEYGALAKFRGYFFLLPFVLRNKRHETNQQEEGGHNSFAILIIIVCVATFRLLPSSGRNCLFGVDLFVWDVVTYRFVPPHAHRHTLLPHAHASCLKAKERYVYDKRTRLSRCKPNGQVTAAVRCSTLPCSTTTIT